jgi:hypothetical protein
MFTVQQVRPAGRTAKKPASQRDAGSGLTYRTETISDGGVATLIGADADDFLQRHDEHLPVTDLARFRG